MERPFIVCHMLSSVDGKIDGEFFRLPENGPAGKAYGDIRGYYGCQATLYGTTTMLGGYADGYAPDKLPEGEPLPREDWVSEEGRATGNFIVSVDPMGRLAFSTAILEKKGRAPAHVIEALTGKVSDGYLRYLRERGISYVFAGEDRLDCGLLARKLLVRFGIRRLMVAGGGVADWSFLREGLLDELSLVLTPIADGSTTAVSIFENADFLPPHPPVALRLLEVKQLEGDVLWLRYQPK